MTPPDPDAAARLDALLAEGAWLKRLARGLLADPAGADDLAQDVLVAALARRPALEGARLRGWLATVARRIAGRRRERAAAHAVSERKAARPEEVERDALCRLELHRRVAAAILALEPPYRAAILLRYLEDLPPRAIAQRLGIAETAARKRVSRGLAQLRETLDAEDAGGSSSWALAAASLVRAAGEPIAPDLAPAPSASAPAPSAPRTPPIARRGLSEVARGLLDAAHPAGASTTPLTPLLALMTSKLALLSCLAIAAAAAVLWVARDRGATSARFDSLAVAHADAGLAPASLGPDVVAPGPIRTGDRPARLAIEPAPTPASDASVRLRVVDEDGAPIPGATAAWLDAALAVHALELDAGASASLPAAEAAWLAAGAEGRVTAWRVGFEDEVDVVLALERAVPALGRVVEDGGAPARPFDLGVSREVAGGRAERRDDARVRAALRAAGFPSLDEEVRVSADGAFAIPGLRAGESVEIRLPSSHSLLPADEAAPHVVRGATQVAGAPPVVLRTTRLPSVRGRLVWADDGSPVPCGLTVEYVNDRGFHTLFQERADRDGRFEIGLPIPGEDLLLPPSQRTRVGCASLRLRASGDGERLSTGLDHTAEFEPGDLPLDLGDLRVPPALLVAVRVADPDGAPVEGAVVASRLELARTDAGGAARVAVGLDDTIDVLAHGFALARTPVGAADALDVRLSPGTSLVVAAGAEAHGLGVRLAWERTPFEGADDEHGAVPFRVHSGLHGGLTLSGGPRAEGLPGEAIFTIPLDRDLAISGLTRGAAFSVALLDALGEPIAERAVVLPDAAGPHRIELAPPQLATLCVELVDAADRPVEGGGIGLRRAAGGSREWFPASAGRVVVQRLAATDYDVLARAPGFLAAEIGPHRLEPGAPGLGIVLERARSLEVRVVDETGRALAYRSLALAAQDGWIERTGAGDTPLHVLAPQVPIAIQAEVGTRRHRADVDALAETAVVRAPRHARVRIELAAVPAVATLRAEVRVRLRDEQGAEVDAEIPFHDGAAGPLAHAFDLLPGAYALEVDLVESTARDALAQVRALDRRTIEVDADATIVIPVAR